MVWNLKYFCAVAFTALSTSFVVAVKAQDAQQMVQLMGPARYVSVNAQFSSEKSIGSNDLIPVSGRDYATDGVQLDATGCNATVTNPPFRSQPGDSWPWSLREPVRITVTPMERSVYSLTMAGKKEWVMTSTIPAVTVMTISYSNRKDHIGTWLFPDMNQANSAVAIVKRMVAACGATAQEWQDAQLQMKIDKAMKKANKPPSAWRAALGDLVQYETDPVGYQESHQPNYVYFVCWARPENNSNDSRFWFSKQFSTDMHIHDQGQIEGRFLQYIHDNIFQGETRHLCSYFPTSELASDYKQSMYTDFKRDGARISMDIWPASYEY